MSSYSHTLNHLQEMDLWLELEIHFLIFFVLVEVVFFSFSFFTLNAGGSHERVYHKERKIRNDHKSPLVLAHIKTNLDLFISSGPHGESDLRSTLTWTLFIYI